MEELSEALDWLRMSRKMADNGSRNLFDKEEVRQGFDRGIMMEVGCGIDEGGLVWPSDITELVDEASDEAI